MRIGIDIMGGDFAPEATVLGSILAFRELGQEDKIVLIGDESKIKEICTREKFDYSVFEIVHTTECIAMGEHPAKALQQKPNSSIAIGFNMLKNQQIDGFSSAGNTGAMMVGALFTVKQIEGVLRPVIGSLIPNGTDKPTYLLDVGINPDAKPEVLAQYALLGSTYYKYMFDIQNPRVALLNLGEEEEKGNLLVKAVYPLLKESKNINFVGNVEGNDFFNNKKADVVVCDGFVGNIVLKEAEAFYKLLINRGIHDEFFESFNYENFGGAPILGVNAPAIIGHGVSTDIAIKNMILQTRHIIKAGLTQHIKEAFK